MSKQKIDWARETGRRLRLRDLHVFSTVAECGSMAKAADKLGVAQPTVSEVIADLEHTYGVRLFDRSPRGVEPTIYGHALLKRSIAVFDEIKQSGRDIEFLANATVGELRIGCVGSLSATIVPQLILRFSQQYPGVLVQIDDLTAPATDFQALRDRKYDCMLVRLTTNPPPDEHLMDELNAEVLFDDRLVIAASGSSPWARRRKIGLAELVDEPWIFPPRGTWNYICMAEAFQDRGLSLPKPALVSFSITLRTRLVAAGPYLTTFANSVMKLNARYYNLAILPIILPTQPWPVVIVTLKHRTLSPVVERFIACAHVVAKSFVQKETRRS
jgi:DNA-binding transcriptional LysR family regulator